jgi:uncharacterized protein (DUF305 family)
MAARVRRGVLAIVTVGVATGCAAGGAARGEQPGPLTADEMEEIYLARQDSARMRFTEADVRFMTRMIHHHAQAIEMAELVPERTTNPQIRTLAGRIINAQNDEMAIMRRWLEDRAQPVPPPPAEMAAHAAMGHAAAHPMDMPGMATPAQLQALRGARGTAFDRLFLTLMIDHHRGAVTMVHELFATDGAGQDEEVFKFASDAQVDQGTEVARMEAMLEALPPEPVR